MCVSLSLALSFAFFKPDGQNEYNCVSVCVCRMRSALAIAQLQKADDDRAVSLLTLHFIIAF